MTQRTQLKCKKCGSLVSRSNFERHTTSKACKNGEKGCTKKEKYPWTEWAIGNNLYSLPSGYVGTKISCRNKLNQLSATASNPRGNFSSYLESVASGHREVYNKGKETTEEQKAKLSIALKKYHKINGPQIHSEETRKLQSEKKKKFYREHPEKHPNSKMAGNRNKMTYPEKVALDWFIKEGIEAKHNQRIDRFYPDFTIGNIIVEIDGERWHSSVEQKERDSNRDKILKGLGYQIYRIPTKEHIETRLQEIFK